MTSAVESALCPSDISLFVFYFWDFLEESICVDTPTTITELKETSVSSSAIFFHKWPTRKLQIQRAPVAGGDPAQESSNGVIYSKRCWCMAEGRMTDNMVNLLCHFIGNRTIPLFLEIMSILLTWTPCSCDKFGGLVFELPKCVSGFCARMSMYGCPQLIAE